MLLAWYAPDAESTTFYAKYKSTGAGANPAARVPWSHQLTAERIKAYSLENVFGDWDVNSPDN